MNSNKIINISIAIVLQVLTSVEATSQKFHRSSCHREATFKANGGNFMVKASSSKLISTTSVPSLAQCSRSCVRNDDCKSMVYKKKPATTKEKNCQILNVERSKLTNDDMVASTGWQYYEPVKMDTSRCYQNVCQPGSQCVGICNPSNTIKYECKDINECESNPCQNGGTCTNEVNSYSCKCRAGFTGSSCETNINECSSSPCSGKTCYDGVNYYFCACPENYMGPDCSQWSNRFITSPNYPNLYTHFLTRTWNLSVPSGRLMLYFQDFSTEISHDTLELRDGDSSSARLLGELSGTTPQDKTYTATGRYMYAKFVTDRSNLDRGFKAYIGES